MEYVLVGYGKNINQISDIFTREEKESRDIFIYSMLELERNAHCVAFQNDSEKGYHWNDPSWHLHA